MFVSLKRRNGKMTAKIAGAGDDDPGVLLRCAGWAGLINEIDYNGFILTPKQCLGLLAEIKKKIPKYEG